MRTSLALVFLVACSTPTEAPAPAPAPVDPAPVAAPAPVAHELEVPPERAVTVTLPSGKAVTADHVVNPAEGTPEQAIVESIKLISSGDFDTFVSTWCHASACGDSDSIESMKTYNLPAAQGTARACLGDDGQSVTVTRRDPPEADGLVRVFVYCGPDRMPAPAALYLVDGRYRVASLSW